MKFEIDKFSKYIKTYDKKVFMSILRTLKDSGEYNLFKLNCGNNFTNIINKCYSSRMSHPGEKVWQNIIYWPGDAEIIPLQRHNSWNKFMFTIRVINALPVEEAKKLFKSCNVLSMLNEVRLKESEFERIPSDMIEVCKAFDKCSSNIPNDAVFAKINGLIEGIPF